MGNCQNSFCICKTQLFKLSNLIIVTLFTRPGSHILNYFVFFSFSVDDIKTHILLNGQDTDETVYFIGNVIKFWIVVYVKKYIYAEIKSNDPIKISDLIDKNLLFLPTFGKITKRMKRKKEKE